MGTHFDKNLVAWVAMHVGAPEVPEDWSGVDAVLPLLERIRGEGAVVLFKLDGERKTAPYTAVISGPPLQGVSLRVDAKTLEEALARVIVFYAERQWGFVPPV